MMMSRAIALALAMATNVALAGGVPTILMDEKTVAAGTSSSAGGILVGLFLLLAAAVPGATSGATF